MYFEKESRCCEVYNVNTNQKHEGRDVWGEG